MSRVILIISLVILPFFLYTQTIISWGNVSGHWIQENGPYYIQGNISIDESDSLVIDAGVEVIFMDNYSFPVFGYLEANGTELDSIYFTVADTSGYSNGSHMGWSGLNIIIYPAKANLNYCVVEYSKAAGISLMDSELLLENSVIRYNQGDGINCWNSTASLSHISINNNDGNGLSVDGFQEVNLNDFSILNNFGYGLVASQHPGLVASNGIINGNYFSGVRVDFESGPVLSDLTIENNGNSIFNGGGIYATGGFSLTNSSIRNNYALNGGGIYYMAYGGEDMEMIGSEIEGNVAENEGGGIYLNCGEMNLFESVVSNNSSINGGGVYFNDETFMGLNVFERVEISNNTASEKGGGIYFGRVYDNPELSQLTIVNNSAMVSGGGVIYEVYDWNTVYFNNSILWNNGDMQIIDDFGKLSFTNSDIENGWTGEGNIDEDPRFIDPLNGDFGISWNDYPNNNITRSPCIDAGDITTMMDPDNTIADIGAYYFNQTIQMPEFALVQINVFLQGPFVSDNMQSSLNENDLIPLSQPFDDSPWNYNGEESVSAIPSTNIIDWVFVEFRDAVNAVSANGSTIIQQQAAFLMEDGKVVGLDGESLLQLESDINHNLFIVIRHRNHIAVMSADPVESLNNVYTYDFTNNPLGIFESDQSIANLGSGKWGMLASDANGNGQIDNVDKVDYWAVQYSNTGYLQGDFNLDSQVDMQDKTQTWNLNSGKKCHIPE